MTSGTTGSALDRDTSAVLDALVRLELISPTERPALEPLAGGVSSDIYRVQARRGPICVKRARPTLAVEALWEVDVERNRYEYAWLDVVAGIAPDAVPELLGRDDQSGLFAMAYLDPDENPVWKTELLAGRVEPSVGAAVGDVVGRIHAATADVAELATRFATDELFRDLRLDPYLTATAHCHPELAETIAAIDETTQTTRRVLVHGDVSPKNILLGSAGPVLLDAECAWFGDPAFDLAFCTNHLLLKAFHEPDSRNDLIDTSNALVDSYLAHVDWEDPAEMQARTARLLPALMLARIDGKSPVEYLEKTGRERVRGWAVQRLAEGPSTLAELAADIIEDNQEDGSG